MFYIKSKDSRVKSYLSKIWDLSNKFENFDLKCQNHGKDNHISFEIAKSSVYNFLNRNGRMIQNPNRIQNPYSVQNKKNPKDTKTYKLVDEKKPIQHKKKVQFNESVQFKLIWKINPLVLIHNYAIANEPVQIVDFYGTNIYINN